MNQKIKHEVARACYEHVTSGGNKKFIQFGIVAHGGDRHWASFTVTRRPTRPIKFIAIPDDHDAAPWIQGELIERGTKRVVGYIKSWQGDAAGNMNIMYWGEIEPLTEGSKDILTIKLED
jgi:hypothetical protein